MNNLSKSIISCVCVLILAIFLQTLFNANLDAVWLLHCADSILHDGTYYYNFIEVNPPLILYFYMPAIFLSTVFNITPYIALIIYLFFFVILILIINYFLLKKIFCSQPNLTWLFLFIFTACFTVLPLNQFSERENLAVILILPYLLFTGLRLQNKSTSHFAGFIFGILAAIGLSFKPYFVPVFLFIEIYYLYAKRNLLAWIKIETLTILVFMIIYLVSTIIFSLPFFLRCCRLRKSYIFLFI